MDFDKKDIVETGSRMVARLVEKMSYTYKIGDPIDSLLDQLPEDKRLVAILSLLKTLRGYELLDKNNVEDSEELQEEKRREYQRNYYNKNRKKIQTQKRDAYRKKKNITSKTKGRPCLNSEDELPVT